MYLFPSFFNVLLLIKKYQILAKKIMRNQKNTLLLQLEKM